MSSRTVIIEKKNSIEFLSEEELKQQEYITEIADGLREEDQGVKVRDVLRISPVQFLRDRELGIRGTDHRIVRQRVTIDTEVFPRDIWTSDVKRKMFRRLRNWCVSEKEAENAARCADNLFPHYIQPLVNYQYWAIEILENLQYGQCETLYIQMYTGIGKYVELAVMNNSIDMYGSIDPNHISMLENIYERESEDLDNDSYLDAPVFCLHYLMLRHFHVLYCKRYCSMCDRVTCKCPIEQCDVI